MKRRCKSIEQDTELKDLFFEILNGLHSLGLPFGRNVQFYVDTENENEIKEMLLKEKNRKRLRRILATIVEGKERPDLYGREDVSSKAEEVKGMKFTGAKRGNPRVYCREYIMQDEVRIVMVHTCLKKSQKVTGKLKNRLEIIGGYKYEF